MSETTQGDNGNSALTLYGGRGEIKELSQRITKMLPGVRRLGDAGALALAQVAHSMGLNPFTGEVWAIEQRNRSGQVVGFSIMAGIKGLRRAAKVQARKDGGIYPFYNPRFRMMTGEEKEFYDIQKGDRGLVCELEILLAPNHPWYQANDYQRYTVEGVGIYRAGERTRMEPGQVVRKRAEADALKIAFDLPFGDQHAGGDYEAIDGEYDVIDDIPDSPVSDTAFDSSVEENERSEARVPEPEPAAPATTSAKEEKLEKSNTETPPPTKFWPATTVQALKDAGLASGPHQAVGRLNKSKVLDPNDPPDVAVRWARIYDDARANGLTSDEAAAKADADFEAAVAADDDDEVTPEEMMEAFEELTGEQAQEEVAQQEMFS